MSTAIIGVGNIGKAVATHLTDGGEPVVLAAGTPGEAEQLARDLGPSASAAGVADAIDQVRRMR
jgi:8-hydroxy-5-deazaflavin:NADPH oxidoreductase